MKRYRKVKIPKSPKAFLVSLIMIGIIGCYTAYQNNLFMPKKEETPIAQVSYDLENIPPYQGNAYVVINQNEPKFTESDINFVGESYSDFDSLGRCGIAMARVGIDTMPTEERGSIGMVKPSGWHTVKYDIVSGKYLYNRCHLIGYQLTGENANEKNLITCTRSMNTTGMLEWENKVADYVKETKNHVLYRVTPMFQDENLVATGVQIEALSLEDNGEGVKFNVFVYNVQEGIEIDYKTGDSKLKE